MLNVRLYVILDPNVSSFHSVFKIAESAIAGGATVIQLRDKKASMHELIRIGKVLHEITKKAGIPLIINDYVDVALTIGAEGVHVGQDDMPVNLARQILGKERIIGVSAGTVEEAKKAEEVGADYIGVGPVFATKSKKDAGKPIGISGLKKIVEAVRIPVVAIGGINLTNAEEVMRTGTSGIAVISAIVNAENPERVARNLRSVIEATR